MLPGVLVMGPIEVLVDNYLVVIMEGFNYYKIHDNMWNKSSI